MIARDLPKSISALELELKGDVVGPDDPGYDDARTVWNAMIDRRPALIVRCADADDVAHAHLVRARTWTRDIIRGGGHNIAGNALCEDGVMIDLSAMRSVAWTPRRSARMSSRRDAGRLRQGDAGTRAGHAGRNQLDHRDRGSHARWRIRLANAQARHDRRQSGLRRCGHRGRQEDPSQRERKCRPVLGHSRRRRELWRLSRNSNSTFTEVGPEILAGLIVFPFDQAKHVLRQYREFVEIRTGRAQRVGSSCAKLPRCRFFRQTCMARRSSRSSSSILGMVHKAGN